MHYFVKKYPELWNLLFTFITLVSVLVLSGTINSATVKASTTIGPNTVYTTTYSATELQHWYNHYIFYANGLHWVFYSGDGIHGMYRTSSDGITWSNATNFCDEASFVIYFDGTNVNYTAHNNAGTAILYRRGTLNSNGTISWVADAQTVYNTINGLILGMAVDSSGYVWISWCGDATSSYVTRSGNNDGTWGTPPAGFPYNYGSAYSTNDSVILQLTAGKILLVYHGDTSSQLSLIGYNGASWRTPVSTSTVSFSGYFSAVAVGDDAYILAYDDGGDLKLFKYTYSTNTINTGVTVVTQGSTKVYAGLSKDSNNNIYCFYTGIPTPDHVYYRIYNGSSMATAVDWLDESANTLTLPYNYAYVQPGGFTTSYASYGGFIGVSYVTKSSRPYSIRFAALSIDPSAPTAPTVTTQNADYLHTTWVIGHGTITNMGGENASVYGFKYGLTETDTWDVHMTASLGASIFTVPITGLSPNTTYYYRAYATNSAGTDYDPSYHSFTTPPANITSTISTIDHTTPIHVGVGDGTVLYNGYIYISSRYFAGAATIAKINTSEYADIITTTITGAGGDSICVADGYLWVGGTISPDGHIFQLSLTDLSLIHDYAVFTSPGSTAECMTSDSEYIYVGGIASGSNSLPIAKIKISDRTITEATLAIGNTGSFIHNICQDGNYLYGGINDGYTGYSFKVLKSDLSLVNYANLSASYDYNGILGSQIHDDNQQDATYFYMNGPNLKRISKSDLSETDLEIPDVVGNRGEGIGAQALLENGDLLAVDSSHPQFFYIKADMTYAQGIAITGMLDDYWDQNKILIDGNYFHILTIQNDPGYVRLYKFNTNNIPRVTTPTSTALNSSFNPSSHGQIVTFTATVSAVPSASRAPTGTVAFQDGTQVIGIGTLNGSGQAIYSTSALSAGSHSISAIYGSDEYFTSSTSAILYQNIWNWGDANGDGFIDMGDVVKLERVILGFDPETCSCDATKDGMINMGDATKIERIILGLDLQ